MKSGLPRESFYKNKYGEEFLAPKSQRWTEIIVVPLFEKPFLEMLIIKFATRKLEAKE